MKYLFLALFALLGFGIFLNAQSNKRFAERLEEFSQVHPYKTTNDILLKNEDRFFRRSHFKRHKQHYIKDSIGVYLVDYKKTLLENRSSIKALHSHLSNMLKKPILPTHSYCSPSECQSAHTYFEKINSMSAFGTLSIERIKDNPKHIKVKMDDRLWLALCQIATIQEQGILLQQSSTLKSDWCVYKL